MNKHKVYVSLIIILAASVYSITCIYNSERTSACGQIDLKRKKLNNTYSYVGKSSVGTLLFDEIVNTENSRYLLHFESVIIPFPEQIDHFKNVYTKSEGYLTNRNNIIPDEELYYCDAEINFFNSKLSLVYDLLGEPNFKNHELVIYEIPSYLNRRIASVKYPIYLAIEYKNDDITKLYKFTLKNEKIGVEN